MQPPPRTPVAPRASTPRRGMPPSLLSPSYSRRAFPATSAAAAAASAASDLDAAERPCVTMFEWWLTRVEGDDRKIAVGGLFERNQTVQEFAPATITKRYETCVVETEDGIVLLIRGSLNVSRTIANGYSSKVCENFMIGFPCWWQSCNLLYPKETGTGNSEVDSTRFYLEKFQLGERFHSHGTSLLSELLNSVRSYSRNDAAFQKSSHLPNGAPRFEEYTGDGDIAINENAAASNDDRERHEAACNEVYNVDMHMTACRALRERDGGYIDTHASLVLTVQCPNDAANEEADSATPTSTCDQRKAQHVALSKKAASKQNEDVPTSVCLDVQNSYLPNRTPRFEEYTCDGDIATNENAAASNDDRERDEAVCNEVDNVEIHLTVDRALTERDDGDIDINASLVLTMECTNDASNEEADNALSTSDQRTPVISLKTQGCWEKTGHVALNKKAAVDEGMPTSVCLDVQNSSYLSNETTRLEKNTCIGDTPTNEGAAALNDNSERCTSVPEEVNSVETSFIVGSVTRERGHDDVATNVSLTPTVECTNDAVNEGVDNTSLLGCKTTPVASLKSQGCQEKQQHIPSNEKQPSGPPKKQRSALEKLRGATRSPLTSPVPYAHDSPLTRGRTTSLSMSTPESLKLRKTRSGRVVVPTLDKGCQRIVYDMDGAIVGVVGLDSPSPKGSKLETNARKKKNAEPAVAASYKLKTYARKKRRAE
ncbi:hypothetical protein SEVIR_7G063100v4 [Setaria viridis]|uniref:SANTA domain-containing protein n=1 Tax=Setaria viridis TaxID=4556 RepID=A0A4U6TM62_SETVI|nr:uncharacterized protein LOC117865429 isoform X1 [Setaria viridis]TKW03748.1 hypothetical protein SEVIR_7G063100v2 [Setaria viridis]